MGLDSKAGFVGLVTASGEATATQGALRVADNVTLRKEGALVCRPTYTSSALLRAYLAAFPYKGALYYVGPDNVPYRPNQFQFSGAAPAVRADIQAAKEARGNLYFASVEGVSKILSTSDSVWSQTGLTPNWASIGYAGAYSTTGTELLAANQQVAYRIVATYVDSNGVVIRSRPSGAVLVASGASSATPIISMHHSTFSTTTGSNRKIEVYRTRIFPTSTQVDDEMQLVATIDIANTGSTGSPGIQDKVPDARRGTTLYTSPSRGGIENANDRPPGCACLERFRGSLFFGNTVGPHRFVFSYKPSNVNLAGSAAGVGIRQTTGSITSGSTQITGVANTAGVQVGMMCLFSAAGISISRVTAIAGSTVTLSQAATTSASGQLIMFYDALLVDGLSVPLGIGAQNVAAGWTSTPFATTSGGGYTFSELRFNGDRYTIYELSPPATGYDQTVVVERTARGGAAFQVRATHGDEMSPAIPLGNQSATSLASTNDVLPNGLAWSEPDEPEHVPPKNFARVGDTGKAILGLVATRDRLLIFKEDGLFMLTGDTAKNFAIYPLDTTCICILPGSIRRLKNTVFALTNLGLVAVDENGGVSVVSRPIQTDVAPIVQQIRAAAKTTGLYLMPGLSGTTGAADDANGEYWLALGSTTPSFGGQVLVYSMPREGFTTYSFGASTPVALSTDGEGQPLALTATALLTPSTTQGVVAARISPRAFSDPALVGKLWTHIVVGLSQLTGTASVSAKFSSSESMVTSDVTEVIEAPTSGGLVQLPAGSLLRHPVPRAMARSFLLFAELLINVTSGTFTLELVGAESRENISNKRPTHGTGAT